MSRILAAEAGRWPAPKARAADQPATQPRQPTARPGGSIIGYALATLVVCGLAWLVTEHIEIPSAVIIAVACLSGLALIIGGLRDPAIPLYALVAYVPFSKMLPGDFGHYMTALNATNILSVIAIIAWIIHAMMRREAFLIASPLNGPIALFAILGVAALFHTTAAYGSWYLGSFLIALKQWLTPLFFYFLALNVVKDRATIRRLVILIMIVVTVVGLMAIKEYIDIGPDSSLDKSRVGGIADQPNMLAAFFCYYMFLLISPWLMRWKKFRYALLIIPFLICFRGIMVTFSRGAYLAFVVGLFALAWFRSKTCFLVALVLTVFILVNPWLIPRGIAYRMGMTLDAGKVTDVYEDSMVNELDDSSRGRLAIWAGAIKMIEQHPFWGVGYGVFPNLINLYAPGVGYRDAHNSYLIITAEMGIFALLAFLWIMWRAFRWTYRLYRETDDWFLKAIALGFLAGLFGMLVSNLFGSRLDSQEISSYFFVLAGLIVRARMMERRAIAEARG